MTRVTFNLFRITDSAPSQLYSLIILGISNHEVERVLLGTGTVADSSYHIPMLASNRD